MAQERLIVTVSGVRGTIGGTLTPEIAAEFGSAFATFLAEQGETDASVKKRVAIGRDSRPSGPMVKEAVTKGLTACGVDVIDLGIVTTPGAALMTRLLECDGGIIITASHNPLPYNGIKFLQPTGVALPADQALRLKTIWESKQFIRTNVVGTQSANHRTHPMHIDAVLAVTDVTAVSSKRYKVALDSVNGAGCVGTPMLLSKLGCEVVHINGEPTGEFAHTPEPLKENLTDLCDMVRKQKVHIGFAQDPDADRLVVVDENGEFLGEEYTLALAAAFVLSHRQGKIAVNLSTSRMVDDLAEAAGVEVVRSPTGEANVVAAMQREECIFAGEGNGGVIDPRVVSVRDSFVGMAMLLQYMAETGKPISELAADIPAYCLKKTKITCPPDAAAKVAERTKALFIDNPEATLDQRDGLRIDLADSWVSVRASNTEPIMRIFAEAPTESQANALVKKVQAIADEIVS